VTDAPTYATPSRRQAKEMHALPRQHVLLRSSLLIAVFIAAIACPSEALSSPENEPASPADPADDSPLPGRWNLARPGGSPTVTDAQQQEFERLRSIGYLSGSVEPPAGEGVTLHDEAAAFDGLNFYTSGHMTGAVLMDMDGNVLHEWRHDRHKTWPDDKPEAANGDEVSIITGNPDFWRRAHLFKNGDVLGMCVGLGLVRLDSESREVWKYSGGCHHDLQVMEDGTIYVLTREPRIEPRINRRWPILEDSITLIDPSGREIKSISVLEAFEHSRYRCYLEMLPRKGDVTHTNTLEVLDGTLASRIPAFRKGNVLISLLKLDLIAVVDTDLEEVVWAMSGLWRRQHEPTVVEGEHLLIFDNEGKVFGGGSQASRVIEFDPATQEIVWSYEGGDGVEFYSRRCGTAARLPNGNTLITESDAGRAFEVTPGHEIVWEFLNPERAGENHEYIATLFDVVRIPPDFPLDWLRKD